MKKKVLFLIILLSACNFRPHYTRPDMGLTASFRFAPENAVEYANLPWWEGLGDPVLNELIATALQYNQTLAVATATVSQFYAQYQIAFSQLLPQINGSGNDQRTNWNDVKPPLTFLYQFLMNLSYELDLWGKIRNAVKSAEASYLAQVETRLNVILSIVSGLAKAYILLLQYDNQLEISRETLQGRLELFRVAQLRYGAGLISLIDLKQSEAQLQDAEAQVKIFEGLIPIQEDLISVLLGSQPTAIPRGKLLDQLQLPPQIPAGIPSDLLENRPDICAAEQNLISASAAIGSARAAFFPVFQITGAQGKQSNLLGDLLKTISTYSQWQFDLTQPLFSGGQLRGQLSQAEAVFLENFHTYQQTVLTALQQVSDALVSYQTSQETLDIQLKEIESYKTYLDLSTLRYYNGLNSYLTVEIAQQNLFAVKLAAETTRGTIFTSLINLYTALGQGWDVKADYCPDCDNSTPFWKALVPP